MIETASQSRPRPKLEQAESAFAQVLVDSLKRGFHGTAGVTLSIQDGHIQNIRVAVERMLK